MDWGNLLPVIVGAVLAAGGSLMGQVLVGRQASARERRDRDHEQRVWARQLRHEAHIGFLNEFERLFNVAVNAEVQGHRDRGAEPDYDFLVPLYDRLTLLRTVSDQKTIDAAKAALESLKGYVFGGMPDAAVEYSRDRYLVAMREEFGFPPIRTWEDDVQIEIAGESGPTQPPSGA